MARRGVQSVHDTTATLHALTNFVREQNELSVKIVGFEGDLSK